MAWVFLGINANMVRLSIVLSMLVTIDALAEDSYRILIDTHAPGLRIFKAKDLSSSSSDMATSSTPNPQEKASLWSMLTCSRFPWHTVTSTVFRAGENAIQGGGIANYRSAWDSRWLEHFGADGLGQNPWYVALPVNDVSSFHTTKPEAAKFIPWFRSAYIRPGQSVCKGRWVEIRKRNRSCWAQWEDVGPFHVDSWSYVFGNDQPEPNRNRNTGIDLSPAVQMYLGLGGIDQVSWRFTEFNGVPSRGPWAMYGGNNTFALLRK